MRNDVRRSRVLKLLVLLMAAGESRASQSSATTNPIPQRLFCLPEHFAICDGLGNCTKQRSDDLAAFRFDLVQGRYSLCTRNGRDCMDKGAIGHEVVGSRYYVWDDQTQKGVETQLLLLHSFDRFPESVKIDPIHLRFAAVEIHGIFVEVVGGKLADSPNLGEIEFRQITGTCVVNTLF